MGSKVDELQNDYFFNEETVNFFMTFSNIASATAAVIGIPGNLLVLYSILHSKDMRTVSHIFIFNLALADLFFLSGIPILIFQTVKREWIFGLAICKLFIATSGINQFASSTFIALLSFDRYLAVCHAIVSIQWRTRTFAMILVFVAWIIVMIEMIPIFVYSTIVEHPHEDEDRNKSSCTLFWGDTEFVNDTAKENAIYNRRRLFSVYSFTLSYMLPLSSVWFFYGKIISRVWRRNTRFSSPLHRRIGRTTTKVTFLGLAIVISYTLLYFPFWMSQWLIEAGVSFYKDQSLRMIIAYLAYSLLYVNSALSPFLCVFFTDTFLQNTLRRQSTNNVNRTKLLDSVTYCAVPLSDSFRINGKNIKFSPKSPYICE